MRTRRQLTDRRRREVNIKTEAEIDGIRRASHVTRDILDALDEKIRPGISTEQINQWVNEMTGLPVPSPRR